MNTEINLLNKKIELIQWLSTIEDINVLNKIADLIADKNNKDWWDSTSATEKKSIEKGLEDANNGKLNTHAKARDIYGKWL